MKCDMFTIVLHIFTTANCNKIASTKCFKLFSIFVSTVAAVSSHLGLDFSHCINEAQKLNAPTVKTS